MIRDKFLRRHEWEAKLRRWGCKPLDGLTRLNTAEWWKGPRGVFTVPVEGHDTCDFWAINRLAEWYGERPTKGRRPD